MESLASVPGSPPPPEHPGLRRAIDQLVGSVFYGAMLRSLRASTMKGEYGHGGHGEEVFQAQLDQIIAERAGQAQRYSLNNAIYERLAQQQSRIEQQSQLEGSKQP